MFLPALAKLQKEEERVVLVIEPHRGIGPISFGMIRREVVSAMAAIGGGSPVARNNDTDCYFDNAFQVSFDDAGSVDFIEVCSSFPGDLQFAGCEVFNLGADELLALLRSYEDADADLSEPPDSYTFAGLILSLWGRDEQYDYKGGKQRPVFATIGIGTANYLAAIRAVRTNSAKWVNH